MLNPNQIHLLEQYHKGLLNEEELKEVESWLKDADFKAEAEAYFQLLDGFAALELEAFGEKLHTWEAKYQEQEQTTAKSAGGLIVFLRKYRMAVAAAIILLMMPLGYLAMQSTNNTDRLFADNFTHYKAFTLTTRAVTPAGGEKDAKELTLQVLLNQGINAYNARKYPEAIDFLNRYLEVTEDEKNTEEVHLYLAISQLAEGNTEEAKQLLEPLSKSAESRAVQNAADWYLALTLIKNKEAKPAKKQLKKIARSKKHRYQQKAETLLPKLKHYIKD
jgi:hypothetical protein